MLPYILKIDWYDASKHSSILFLVNPLIYKWNSWTATNHSFSRKACHHFLPLQKPTDFLKGPYDHVGSSQGLSMPRGALGPQNFSPRSSVFRRKTTDFLQNAATTTSPLKVWLKRHLWRSFLIFPMKLAWKFSGIIIWLRSNPGMVPLKNQQHPWRLLGNGLAPPRISQAFPTDWSSKLKPVCCLHFSPNRTASGNFLRPFTHFSRAHSPHRCTSTDCSAKCRLTSCLEEELQAFSWFLKGKHGSSLRWCTCRLNIYSNYIQNIYLCLHGCRLCTGQV